MASIIAMDPIQTLSPSCRCIKTFAKSTICPPMLYRFQWECPTILTKRYVVLHGLLPALSMSACCRLTILMIFLSSDRNGQQHCARWHSYFWTSCHQGNRRRELLEECALSPFALLLLCGFLAQLVVIVVPTPRRLIQLLPNDVQGGQYRALELLLK